MFHSVNLRLAVCFNGHERSTTPPPTYTAMAHIHRWVFCPYRNSHRSAQTAPLNLLMRCIFTPVRLLSYVVATEVSVRSFVQTIKIQAIARAPCGAQTHHRKLAFPLLLLHC